MKSRKAWIFQYGRSWHIGWYEPDGRDQKRSFGALKKAANDFSATKSAGFANASLKVFTPVRTLLTANQLQALRHADSGESPIQCCFRIRLAWEPGRRA